jgi:hypothetical protein
MENQSTPSNIYLIDSNNKREKREPDNSLIYINNPIMPDIEEIAEKDKKILILRDLLQQNKEELNVNQVKINAETKNNSYLNDVLKNYHSYKSYIINMKKRQKEAMENISTHLEKIATENTLGEENLERVNLEQNQILDELDKIKKDLQELTLKSE